MPFRVAIIGSGIVGLALANGLYKQLAHAKSVTPGLDIEIKVFSRRPKEDHSPEGYQVSIGEIGYAALNELLTARDGAKVEALIRENMAQRRMFQADFRTFETICETTPALAPKTPIDRTTLRDILYECIENHNSDTIQHNMVLMNWDIHKPGMWSTLPDYNAVVHLMFQDFSFHVADLLIDTSGPLSNVAPDIGLRNLRKHSTVTIIGSGPYEPRDDEMPVVLGKGSVFAVDGRGTRGYFQYLPLSHPRRAHFALTFRDNIIDPILQSRIDDCNSYRDIEKEGFKYFLVQYLHREGWSEDILPFVASCNEEDLVISRNGTSRPFKPEWRFEQQRLGRMAETYNPRLGSPHVWIVGNAAHQMPQALGAGANTALADAAAAVTAIMRAATARASIFPGVNAYAIEWALAWYEAQAYPRAFSKMNDSLYTVDQLTEHAETYEESEGDWASVFAGNAVLPKVTST